MAEEFRIKPPNRHICTLIERHYKEVGNWSEGLIVTHLTTFLTRDELLVIRTHVREFQI